VVNLLDTAERVSLVHRREGFRAHEATVKEVMDAHADGRIDLHSSPEAGTRFRVTLPVAIFGLTDRGDIFSGAALTMILVAATLALLVGLERLPLGAVGRRA